MIRSESIKGKIRHIAKIKRLSSQEVLQMFFFERFLDRLSHSKYRSHFVIKGGLLIASMIGIENRTTMDMDTTIKGIPLGEAKIREVVEEMIRSEVDDGIRFELKDITYIREEDDYENFRVHLVATFDKINNPMKIDITTGDVITPRAIEYAYPCMFEDGSIKILAYPPETILAEKYESIIKRNITTTRMRDFYDIYSLYRLRPDTIDQKVLKKAIISTAKKRESLDILYRAQEILEDVEEDPYLKEQWETYRKENKYAEDILFDDTLETLRIITARIDLLNER